MSLQPTFYTSGALPADYPHYVVRQADWTATRLLQQGKLIYMIAPRQMGKTSLLKRLMAQLEAQQWCCCLVDLATFRNLERARWFQHIGERVSRACALTTAHTALRDQQDFRTFLLDDVGLGQPHMALKVALFFDEVEGLLGLDFSDDFLMTLRDLYQQRDSFPGQLLIAFAGAVDPQILIKDPNISPFNIAEEIALSDFTAQEALNLTVKLADLGLPMADAVLDHIYAWTAGQPYLTQRICEIIEGWVETRQITRIATDVVDRAVQTGLLSPRARDKNVKRVLTETTRPVASLPKLWRRLLSDDPVYSTEPGFYALYLTGAVAEAPDGQVQIRNNIYRAALGLDNQAKTAAGGGDRPSAHTRRAAPEVAVLNPGQAWAVLVGINTYDEPYIANLSVCVDDVTAVQRALAPGYQTARLLTDATPEHLPTRANILSTLASIAQAAGERDSLLFYFSGHGIAHEGESYLLPRDARLAALRHTAIAMRDLRELLDHSPARARVIVLDACHAGAAMGKAAPTMTPEFIQRVFEEAEGLAVLASCKQGQLSWEWTEHQRSVFTYYLLEAVQGRADGDSKGFVTVSDASRYVTDRVKRWSAENNVPQTPTLQYTVAGDIVLCRYGAATPVPSGAKE